MKIIICGSISAVQPILETKKSLEDMGHEVEIPEGVKNEVLRGRTTVSQSEKANDKIKYDLIRGYYEKIKDHDVVPIVNAEKNGIPGYIDGNTFIEMAFAHVLNKKLCCLYPLPDMPYSSEMIAMQPIILQGDVNKITNSETAQ